MKKYFQLNYKQIIHTNVSLTTAFNVIIFGPSRKFSKIFISRLIFFFFTGYTNKIIIIIIFKVFFLIFLQFKFTFNILTTQRPLFATLIASKTSLYFPRPNFRTN